MQNQKGLKVSGMEMPSPPPNIEKKIFKQQRQDVKVTQQNRIAHRQRMAQIDFAEQMEDDGESTKPLKFQMRQQMQYSMQKTNPVITNLFNPAPPKTGSMPCSTKNKSIEVENPYSDDQLPKSQFDKANFKSPNNTAGVFSGTGDFKGSIDLSKSAKLDSRTNKSVKNDLQDIFSRTHMSGFGSIKQKYAQKLGQKLDDKLNEKTIVGEEDLSHTVRVFRKESMAKPNSRNL